MGPNWCQCNNNSSAYNEHNYVIVIDQKGLRTFYCISARFDLYFAKIMIPEMEGYGVKWQIFEHLALKLRSRWIAQFY